MKLFTFFNLVEPDLNIIISVWAWLFVEKAQGMQKLMLHDNLSVTPLPNRHILSCSISSNIWIASELTK